MPDLIQSRVLKLGVKNCTECLGNNKIPAKGQNSEGKVLVMGFHETYSGPVSLSSAKATMFKIHRLEQDFLRAGNNVKKK